MRAATVIPFAQIGEVRFDPWSGDPLRRRRSRVEVTGLGQIREIGAVTAGDYVAGGGRPRCSQTIILEQATRTMRRGPSRLVPWRPMRRLYAAWHLCRRFSQPDVQ